jgi:mevalonate kinase
MLGHQLDIYYLEDGEPLRAEFSGERGPELQLLFWGVMEKALSRRAPAKGAHGAGATGRFEIANTLPFGAGLGASAALCVAIGRWFAWRGWIAEGELYDFARGLEDLFHGESSGVDVAVAISGQGMRFTRGGPSEPIAMAWSPRWYLSYSGKRGATSDCVARVKALFARDRAGAERIDGQMRAAVAEAQGALADPREGLARLEKAMELALGCFQSWGLAGGEMGDHLASLRRAGAIAAKPTGSGDGGYALSLWRDDPGAAAEGMALVPAGFSPAPPLAGFSPAPPLAGSSSGPPR